MELSFLIILAFPKASSSGFDSNATNNIKFHTLHLAVDLKLNTCSHVHDHIPKTVSLGNSKVKTSFILKLKLPIN
jgi:hypothetical protein